MSQAVLTERHGAVARLCLNRPDSRNALSAEIRESLEALVPSIVADESVRCVLLTANGKAFCAGTDLSSWNDRSPAYTRARIRRAHRWVAQLARADIPIVTAVNGVAMGAGLGLALLGDVVIAAEDARFQAGFARVGAVPDFGIGWTLPRIIGINRAKDMLLTNRPVDAAEALAIGMVSRVVPAAELQKEAMRVAEELANGPTLSLGLTKSLLRAAYDSSAEQYLESEAAAQAVAIASADFGEGVEAFLNRRAPRFRGA